MKERLHRWRERLRQRRTTNAVYRALVGVTGAVVLVGGIIAIPYPGPGWAIVFIGLAILASEFAWAHHTLKFAKGRYDAFMEWFGGQALWFRAVGTAADHGGGGRHPVVRRRAGPDGGMGRGRPAVAAKSDRNRFLRSHPDSMVATAHPLRPLETPR